MKSTLHLNLKREFFAAIAAGTKRIEYRERKPYWRSRLEGRKYDVIKFRNGYATNAPEMLVQFRGLRKLRLPSRTAVSSSSQAMPEETIEC